jgi:hypothetical protein
MRLEAAYVAGLLDGEGTISITSTWANTYAIRVAVGMSVVAEEIITLLHEAYGGRVHPMKPQNERCSPKLRWQVQGELAYDVLAETRPYLILKAPQADLAMQLQHLIRHGKELRGRCFWTVDWRQQAFELQGRIYRLNEKGGHVRYPVRAA